MIDFYEKTCINEYSVCLRPWMHVNYLHELIAKDVAYARMHITSLGLFVWFVA